MQCTVSQRMSWALFGLVELYKMYTIDGLVGAVLHTVRCKVHIEGVLASLLSVLYSMRPIWTAAENFAATTLSVSQKYKPPNIQFTFLFSYYFNPVKGNI